MATLTSRRLASQCVRRIAQTNSQRISLISTSVRQNGGRSLMKSLAVGAGVCAISGTAVLIYALENAVQAAECIAHPVHLHWPHSGYIDSLDYKSVRRGYEVYKQVCQACHSMKFIFYRHFVDVFMTEDEAKAEAAEIIVKDIDPKGQPIERPGTLNDRLPDPYPNKRMAEAANHGAAPPDLSLMSWARHGGDDYIFAILTSYFEAPAGVKVEDKAYNPYFPGGVIAMPQQLFDEGIEYKDGTPATVSQQAKDVTTFLRWCSEPWHDRRKQLFITTLMLVPFVGFWTLYWKKHVWTFVKSQKFANRIVKGREPPKLS
jgi:ubiquinol-cytochrome c reductase cytochrome c1 subunit